MEYATVGIGVNTVAPGVVYTPLHRNTPKDVMESLLPKGRPSMVKDIADAVMYSSGFHFPLTRSRLASRPQT
jgi:NAD(P)-dependent dehydrogenase (short-subunit alcohol dehydrogenase family)